MGYFHHFGCILPDFQSLVEFPSPPAIQIYFKILTLGFSYVKLLFSSDNIHSSPGLDPAVPPALHVLPLSPPIKSLNT